MKINIFTVSFYGEGTFTCRFCSNRLVMADDTQAVLADNGRRNRLSSVTDPGDLHVCGRLIEWRCDTCHVRSEPKYERKMRKRGKQLIQSRSVTPNRKCICGGTLIQREYWPT